MSASPARVARETPSLPEVKRIKTAGRARVPTIIQLASVECGAASLAMILARSGCWVPLEELRTECGVSRDGATMRDIVTAGEQHGLDWTARKGDVTRIDGLAVPAILWWRRNHFVVLERAARGRFHINDPAVGRRVVRPREFLSAFSGLAVSFTTNSSFKRHGHPFRASPSLLRRLRHSNAGILLAALAGVLALIPGLLVPAASQVFVDDVLGANTSRDMVLALAAGLIAVALVRVLLNQVQAHALARVQAKLAIVDSVRMLDALLRLPIPFFWQRTVGDLATRVSYPARIAALLAGQVAASAISLIAVTGYAALMIWYDWRLALVVIGLALTNIVALVVSQRKRRDNQMRVLREASAVQSIAIHTAQGIETLKSSGSESAAFAQWAGAQANLISAQASLAGSTAVLGAVPVLLNALTAASILVLGGFGIAAGSLTAGTLVAFLAAASGLNQPISQLVIMAAQLQTISADLQRMDDVVDQPLATRFTSQRPREPGQPIARLAGGLQFRNVTYGYRRNHEPVVADFNLEIDPGARVALVGVSGSGKSTIANLAVGLLQPWSGEVLFDGMRLDQLQAGSLGRSAAKVDQTIVMFQASVIENLTLWDPTVPAVDVRRALADARLLDDVLARPGGLSTAVEEGGRNFSGGQRQRLEVARALVHDPQLLVLDEATSALDAVTEFEIDQAIRARGCTCLIVAHRLSTIRDCDEIVVLGPRGRVVERGNHNELMARGGTYSELVCGADLGGDVGA